MAKPIVAPPPPELPSPTPPEPSTTDPLEGQQDAADLAARYLPDSVKLLAAVAFGCNRATLHTRMMAARTLVYVAKDRTVTPTDDA